MGESRGGESLLRPRSIPDHADKSADATVVVAADVAARVRNAPSKESLGVAAHQARELANKGKLTTLEAEDAMSEVAPRARELHAEQIAQLKKRAGAAFESLIKSHDDITEFGGMKRQEARAQMTETAQEAKRLGAHELAYGIIAKRQEFLLKRHLVEAVKRDYGSLDSAEGVFLRMVDKDNGPLFIERGISYEDEQAMHLDTATPLRDDSIEEYSSQQGGEPVKLILHREQFTEPNQGKLLIRFRVEMKTAQAEKEKNDHATFDTAKKDLQRDIREVMLSLLSQPRTIEHIEVLTDSLIERANTEIGYRSDERDEVQDAPRHTDYFEQRQFMNDGVMYTLRVGVETSAEGKQYFTGGIRRESRRPEKQEESVPASLAPHLKRLEEFRAGKPDRRVDMLIYQIGNEQFYRFSTGQHPGEPGSYNPSYEIPLDATYVRTISWENDKNKREMAEVMNTVPEMDTPASKRQKNEAIQAAETERREEIDRYLKEDILKTAIKEKDGTFTKAQAEAFIVKAKALLKDAKLPFQHDDYFSVPIKVDRGFFSGVKNEKLIIEVTTYQGKPSIGVSIK